MKQTQNVRTTLDKYKTYENIPDDYMDRLYGRQYNGSCPRWRQKSKQYTFNVCAKHMLKQRQRSLKKGLGKLYSGPRGLKCPIRVLIPNGLWNKEKMEHTSCDCGPVFLALRKVGYDPDFCKEIQRIHDEVKPSLWVNALNRLAKRYGLDGVKKEWIREKRK